MDKEYAHVLAKVWLDRAVELSCGGTGIAGERIL